MSSHKAQPFHTIDIPNLTSYTIIVTGGTSGIGHQTALKLALHGARVYIGARSADNIAATISAMRATHREQALDLHALVLDLQSLQSVRKAVEAFIGKEERLDILINNAGVMAPPYALTPDGFETQFQTNHLAPFHLTTLLLPLLKATAAAHADKNRVRIVNVSSSAAFMMKPADMDLERPGLEYKKDVMAGMKRYSHSKLALHLSLTTHLSTISHKNAWHITTASIHPGIVSTRLQVQNTSMFGTVLRHAVRWGWVPGTVGVEEGARVGLWCAVCRGGEMGGGGGFWGPGGVRMGEGKKGWEGGVVEAWGERVWERSLRLIEKVESRKG